MKCQDFFFYSKVISSPRAVKMLFLSFSCEDIGVAMVTNMISQLQESFPLRHAAGSFAVIEFFSSLLEFWLFWTENINIIVFISPL